MMKTALSLAVLALAVTSASVASADEPVSTTTTSQANGGGGASFSASTSDGATASSSGAATTPGEGGDAVKEVLPWVVGGLGAASLITGIVLHVAAPDLPANCIEGTRTCTRRANQSDASFNEDQEQAGEAQLMPNLGNVAIAGGAVLLVAGVSMYFWYRQDSSGKSASNKPGESPLRKPLITPYAGPTGGGLAGLIRF